MLLETMMGCERKEKEATGGWTGRSDLDQGIRERFFEEVAFCEQAVQLEGRWGVCKGG